MSDAVGLTPADPKDLAGTIASGLCYRGRERVRDADEIMVWIVAERLVRHLEGSGFVIMQTPPGIGGAALGRGHRRAMMSG
jgi:hypothetical protein